ncbi:RNA-directed DNA polymerase from mobile element jockey [Trichonephila clavipes]|nr:RNA-directed DNA polymerase from mobile element jockey [Trichonephila clavipes]
MFDTSSFANPTPLAHADTSRDVLPRGGTSHRFLGLHMDSRLTYKKHIDYFSEKFWGKINLAISLIGRKSPVSIENKVILCKQVLRPVITYASPVWGAAAVTHMKKIRVTQNKILRLTTNAS